MNHKLITPLLDSLEVKQQSDYNKIATESHLRNRLSGEYPFLQLTPENIDTYRLGFVSACMYMTEQEIKKMESEAVDTGIVDDVVK